ncbi:MAG: hypothetical protein HY053_00655 [Proteobacteria bacterium]|nr:hypothetical protein [Pseudomonadota bacterium]
MGKINIFTVLTVLIVQGIVGYLWYGPHLFGDVMTGHAIDVFKTDITSLVLMVLTAYGLTHVLDGLITSNGVKDVNGGIKLGLTVGSFMLGFPAIMLLNLLGFGTNMLLVIFGYLVIVTIMTTMVIIKLKKV